MSTTHTVLIAELYAIGVIHNPEKQPGPGGGGTAEARVEVDERYADALLHIEDYDEILIVYWLDRVPPEDRNILQVHPRGDRSRPMRGVFATRSPVRPNPIAITKVRLLRCEGCTLLVEGLDALDGSPLLDIKMA